MLRVQKGTLPFAEKSESYFVHCCRTDRPGMTHIELLNALIRQITESRQSRPARLESGDKVTPGQDQGTIGLLHKCGGDAADLCNQ